MAIAPQERLRTEPEGVKLGQDFLIFVPETTLSRGDKPFEGFSAQRTLRTPELSLLFYFNALETMSYDFYENDQLEKLRGMGINLPDEKTKVDLTAVSRLHVGSKPWERISEWIKDLHLQVYLPDLSPVFEASFGFSGENGDRRIFTGPFEPIHPAADGDQLNKYLFKDFEWLSQMYGKFVKHPIKT